MEKNVMDDNKAPLMLSVSGLRGLVGRSLTPPVAAKYGAAVGQWLRETCRIRDRGTPPGAPGSAPRVVIGRDSRPSGEVFEMAVASGLAAVGCQVIRLGIVSTPGVALMAGHLNADGGVVVTASHNPIEWNGIKVLRHDGVAPTAEQAERIIRIFHEEAAVYAAPTDIPTVISNDSSIQVHADRVLTHVDIEAIRARGLKVVLDSVHGAGGPETAELLERLGVECVHLWAEPTGLFPHTPEPTRENLTALCEAVREHGADVGFAQDPDADRLAIVDNTGRYIGEEYTLALAAMHILNRAGGSSRGQVAVANLSSSRMLDDIAAAAGATALRSAVGEANVAEVMKQHHAVIGGEGNGGVIFPPVSHVRDSLVGIALVLELLATTGRPLDQLVAGIPSYAIVKDKVAIRPGMTDGLEATLRQAFPDQRFDTQDGVRVDWPDRWVHVRASNTEPILRVIAEAADEPAALALISRTRAALGL